MDEEYGKYQYCFFLTTVSSATYLMSCCPHVYDAYEILNPVHLLHLN